LKFNVRICAFGRPKIALGLPSAQVLTLNLKQFSVPEYHNIYNISAASRKLPRIFIGLM